jgi:hypothetical protein
MNSGTLHKEQFKRIISNWFCALLCVTLMMTISACTASYRPVIINPELNRWDGKRMLKMGETFTQDAPAHRLQSTSQ